MRHQWRILLFRNYSRSHLRVPNTSQVLLPSIPPRTHSIRNVSSLSHFTNPFCTRKELPMLSYKNSLINRCSFSSEAAVEQKGPDHVVVTVTDIFTRFHDSNDLIRVLELNGVVISHEMILKVLKHVESQPDVARRFFYWVSESNGENLSSKSYNRMLSILGVHGLVEEFWSLVDVMKKKGYGISGPVLDKVAAVYEKQGLQTVWERLRGVFASGSVDTTMEKVWNVCDIVRNNLWGVHVEEKLRDLNVTFSTALVKMVVVRLGTEPAKALIFFRWVEECGLVKHDELSYNAMARVLGREDCLDRFWKVVDEMKSNGYEMDVETFRIVLTRLCGRKMIKDAVDLFEFAMAGSIKPPVRCCTFLLKKIAVSEQFDMGLFSRAVRIFKESGYVLTTRSMFNDVLRALTSVGRGECNEVLKIMEEGGFLAGHNLQSRIIFGLASSGKKDEIAEFMDQLEASNTILDHKAWTCLIQGCCAAGDLETATTYFQKMVEKEGVSHADYVFEWLVYFYCGRKRAMDAYKLLQRYVSENQLRPRHLTCLELIRQILAQVEFEDALNVLSWMQDHGFLPFVDPVIRYRSKSGNTDDAISFLKSMTQKNFPPMSMVLSVFQAFLKAGRRSEAQELLSKCPGNVRNNADVLNLFASFK